MASFFVLFNSLLPYCYIPGLSVPRLFVDEVLLFETNKNFTFPPIKLEFDEYATTPKNRTVNGSKLMGPDRFSLEINLVDNVHRLIRPLYYTEGDSFTGQLESPVIVIPSYGLGELPSKARIQYKLTNTNRRFACNKFTKVKETKLVKGVDDVMYTDDFFLERKVEGNRYTSDTIFLEGNNCTMQSVSHDGFASRISC
jgi:hypothetical protein